MVPLDDMELYDFANAARNADDVTIAAPLWTFPPAAVPHVVHERRVRFQNVVEDVGDPEYG